MQQYNAVELEIKELKKRWHNKMAEKNLLARLWDFGLKHTEKSCSSSYGDLVVEVYTRKLLVIYQIFQSI